MVRALIFDFNGVLADDETPHVRCFQQSLWEHGLALTAEDYYGRYLGMDERTCAAALLAARDGFVNVSVHEAIIERKAELFRSVVAVHKPALFSGVDRLVERAALTYRLAIASGGRREQIEHALHGTMIESCFHVIVSAEDVTAGKPDPEIYLHALKRLNAVCPRPPLIRAHECLVIEDSRAGILAAKAAHMWVVAVATTYPADQLTEADLVLPTLDGIQVDEMIRGLPPSRR
ncbi:haloacid dehalogenase [Nitrospira sp.]|nr:haloacid dehalogenase [Nitrospira sp.]